MASYLGFVEDDPFFGPGPIPSESFGYNVPGSTLLDSFAPPSSQALDMPAGPGVPAFPFTPPDTAPSTPGSQPPPQKRSRGVSKFAEDGSLDHANGKWIRTMPDRVDTIDIPPGLSEQGLQTWCKQQDRRSSKNYRQRLLDQKHRYLQAQNRPQASQQQTAVQRTLAPRIISQPVDQAQMAPPVVPMVGAAMPITPTQPPQFRLPQTVAGECSNHLLSAAPQPPPLHRPALRPLTMPEPSPLHDYSRRPRIPHGRQPVAMPGQTFVGATASAPSQALRSVLPKPSVSRLESDGSLLLGFSGRNSTRQALTTLGLAAGIEESNVLIQPDGRFRWVMSGRLQPGKPSYDQLLQMYGFPAGQNIHLPPYTSRSHSSLAPTLSQQRNAPAQTQHPGLLTQERVATDSMATFQQQNKFSSVSAATSSNLTSPIAKRKYTSQGDKASLQHPSKRAVTRKTKPQAAAAWTAPTSHSQAYGQSAKAANHYVSQEACDTVPSTTGQPVYTVLELQRQEQDILHDHSGTSGETISPHSSTDQYSSVSSDFSASHQQETPATHLSSPDGVASGKNGEQSQPASNQSVTGNAEATDGPDEQIVPSTANPFDQRISNILQDDQDDDGSVWSHFNLYDMPSFDV